MLDELAATGADLVARGVFSGELLVNRSVDGVVICKGQAVRRDLPLNFFMDRYTESFTAEMRAFVDAVRHKGAVPVNGLDGRVPIVMALAARKSYEEGLPVRLDSVGSKRKQHK